MTSPTNSTLLLTEELVVGSAMKSGMQLIGEYSNRMAALHHEEFTGFKLGIQPSANRDIALEEGELGQELLRLKLTRMNPWDIYVGPKSGGASSIIASIDRPMMVFQATRESLPQLVSVKFAIEEHNRAAAELIVLRTDEMLEMLRAPSRFTLKVLFSTFGLDAEGIGNVFEAMRRKAIA